MQGDKPPLLTSDLSARGFERVCEWQLCGDRLQRSAPIPAKAGVYAFCVNGVAQYVGVASTNLNRRLYLYGSPGPSQRTNLRLNAVICDQLREGANVEVFIAIPPDLKWEGWCIRGAEGLEAGLIHGHHLPWNIRGAIKPSKVLADDSSKGAPATGSSTPTASTVNGKYGPLRRHLAACGKDRLVMTFSQIEQLVGGLPKSASLHQAWWANHEGNSQAKAWLGASYLAEANPRGRSTVFQKFSR